MSEESESKEKPQQECGKEIVKGGVKIREESTERRLLNSECWLLSKQVKGCGRYEESIEKQKKEKSSGETDKD